MDVVGLTPRLLEHMPRLSVLARTGFRAELKTVFPAVTCSVQSTLLTGLVPSEHGIVGNGWYFRDLGEAYFWRQHNALVRGEKVWETARRYTARLPLMYTQRANTAHISREPSRVPLIGRESLVNVLTPATVPWPALSASASVRRPAASPLYAPLRVHALGGRRLRGSGRPSPWLPSHPPLPHRDR